MQWFTIVAAMTILALGGLIVAEWKHSGLGRWLLKPLASLGFIAAALAAGLPTDGFGWAIVAALVLSFGGDVFLIPKATIWFALGLGSFLLGHLGFAAAFVFRGAAPLWGLVALPIITGIALIVHRWLSPHVPSRLRIPVIAYITVISVMVVLAFATFGHRPDTQGGILLGAAISFFCSDLAVARNRFVSPGFVNRLWGLPLYYGAQLLFAYALATASR